MNNDRTYSAQQYERWARFLQAATLIGTRLLEAEKPTHVGLYREDGFDLVAVNVGRVAIIRDRGFGHGLVTNGGHKDGQGN